ncbi:MAG: hypothetical protein O3C34_06250 [Proteobacteria bacterium]|nr:hypothetical protein [Pseudomonadota bacterium]
MTRMFLTLLFVLALTIKSAVDYVIGQIYDHGVALQDALLQAGINRE